jgi:hypothetical protein
MNTALEYSTKVVQEGDLRCKQSTLNDLAYLTPLRIPLMNPVQGSECLYCLVGIAVMMVYQTECTSKSCYQIVIVNTCKAGHNIRCPLSMSMSTKRLHEQTTFNVYITKDYMNRKMVNGFVPKDIRTDNF